MQGFRLRASLSARVLLFSWASGAGVLAFYTTLNPRPQTQTRYSQRFTRHPPKPSKFRVALLLGLGLRVGVQGVGCGVDGLGSVLNVATKNREIQVLIDTTAQTPTL